MKHTRINLLVVFLFMGLLMVFTACSTKKNAFLNRTYHNLTARDNGYFNANNKVKENADKLFASQKDKYDRILSIYKYGDAKGAKSVETPMDDAIKKSSIVIDRHSMLINGVEYCSWIDDNYMVIGRAQFYKREYTKAMDMFEYVAAQYKTQEIRFDAFLWQAKTYIEQKNYADAENVIGYLQSEKELPKRLKEELEAVSAYYYIILRNYDEAIKHLKIAIPIAGKRATKTRYMFILGQLYQKQQETRRAFEQYSAVVKRNPDYEMAFNAKINRASCIDVRGGKSEEVKKQLMKMMKDEKNHDYLDQIYYALGNIAVQEKDFSKAIEYFKKSSHATTLNTGQKALSYLALGNIYYNKRDYRNAHTYYDSTVAYLDKDHPEYANTVDRSQSLTKLIKYLDTILYEDSVQRIAHMSESDRDKVIDKIIDARIAEYKRKKREEEEKKAQSALFNSAAQSAGGGTTQTTGTSQSQGLWYFYNPSTVSFGYTEFLKKWGSRPLEDNWRRSNKEQLSPEDIAQANGVNDKAKNDTAKDPLDEFRERTQYLKNLPFKPEQLKESTDRLIEAYYRGSLIYKEQFEDYEEAASLAEALVRRFPESDYKLACYYNLYRIYLAAKNQSKAEYYKNILLSKYPNSEYAQIISDPDYLQNYQTRKEVIANFYQDTYEYYKKGDYDMVISRCNEANTKFTANKIKSKFDFLKALATGRKEGASSLETALKEVVKNYPKDEVKQQAEDILAYLANYKNQTQQQLAATASSSNGFTFNADTLHYYVVALPTSAATSAIISALKDKITAYNSKYYAKNNPALSISTATFDSKLTLVIVKSLSDKDVSQDYLYGIQDDREDVFTSLKHASVEQFVITPNNYDKLLIAKDINSYLAFYKINYPEQPHF